MSIRVAAVMALLCGALAGLFLERMASAQEPACRFYKVQAGTLNISNEPAGDSVFIDVLDDGDIVCVTRDQSVGKRDWAFISYKLIKPGEQKKVGGWANPRLLQLLSSSEVAALKGEPVQTPAPAPAPVAPGQIIPGGSLRFDQPIGVGPYPVNGRTIEQLANDIPHFPPIEGLPEPVWKKNCSACHKWDRAQLCEQGSSYAKNPAAALRHPHPYGGAYKVALMQWSKSGCR